MSKQLALAAGVSIFVTACLALAAPALERGSHGLTGAATQATTPAPGQFVPTLPAFGLRG